MSDRGERVRIMLFAIAIVVVSLYTSVGIISNIRADSECRALGYAYGGTYLNFEPWCSTIRPEPKPPTTMSLEEARRLAQ